MNYNKGKGALVIIIIVLVLFGVGFFLLGERTKNTGNEETSDDVLNEALPDLGRVPSFTLSDYDGNQVSLEDFSGKHLVINSWATWCPFCVDELPDFKTVQEEFGDGVVIIAIDRAESLERAKAFTDTLGVTDDDLVLLLDPNDSFYQSIGAFSMPETIFVDDEGIIRIHKRGPMPLDEIREKIEQLITS